MSAADDRPQPSSAAYRQRLMIEVTVLLVVSCITTFVMWRPWHAPTEDDYARVRNGMTRAEVEQLLGPPGDYRSWASRVNILPTDLPQTSQLDRWVTDDGLMWVRYADDKVNWKTYRNPWEDSGVIDAIRRRLGRAFGPRY
jgi:hypothetical protein